MGIVGEYIPHGFNDGSHRFLGQLVGLHVGDGICIDEIVRMTGPEKSQEIDAAFAFRTFKPGKVWVADMRAVSVFALMPGTGIVDIDIVRDLQGGRYHPIFFTMEIVFAFDKDVVEHAARDVDAILPQLLQQQGLGHAALVVLIQDKGDKL